MTPSCHDVQRSLVDESAPRIASAEAHLATCADCSGFAQAQRAAVRLAGQTPTRRARRSHREIGVRALVVLVVLGVSVSAATAWTIGWKRGEPSELVLTPEQAPQIVAAPEEPAPSTEQEAAQQWAALQQLQAVADSSVSAQWREEDVTLRVFGALPGWVAPKKTSPLRSLGKAASPVVYTQEDVP